MVVGGLHPYSIIKTQAIPLGWRGLAGGSFPYIYSMPCFTYNVKFFMPLLQDF